MFYSPLRYPGGKGKLAPFMKQLILDNNLSDGVYVEPFAGGGATALALLFEEYVSRIIINDIDRSIYAFWYSILNFTEQFCESIQHTDVTLEVWESQKRIQENKNSEDLLKLGFSTFFLNRTNRSGIINGGVIGGQKQDGEWKIDVRFNKEDLIRRIKKIAYYKNRIDLYNIDVIKIVEDVLPNLPENTLVYLDPPYYVKGQKLYVNFYTPEDHRILKDYITNNINQKWILTYDATDPILNLYADYRPIKYNLNYSAGRKNKGTEVMFFNPDVVIPNNIHEILKVVES